MSEDGRFWVFGEGTAVAGGDLNSLTGKIGSNGARLKENGVLVRQSEQDEGGLDLVAVSTEKERQNFEYLCCPPPPCPRVVGSLGSSRKSYPFSVGR